MNLETDVLSLYEGGTLPPWGLLYLDINEELATRLVPRAWQSSKEIDQNARQRHFDEWHRDALHTINQHLWPRYDRGLRVWKGASARFMRPLTIADLEVMLHMQHPPDGHRHIDQMPELPYVPTTPRTHLELFRNEDMDDAIHIFEGFGSYFIVRDPAMLGEIENNAGTADDTKLIPVNYLFKRDLQRPRPWQSALLLLPSERLDQFNYLEATSALTPSMCSGHCLQSLIDIGGAMERYYDDNKNVDAIRRMAQWAIDIGDRRVMAGVHFPSDNICSWFIFLKMAEFVYHRPEVRRIFVEEIPARSFVYQEVLNYANSAAGEVYREPLKLLAEFHSSEPPSLDS